ncbi:HlyD family secretion protein [Clostridium aciditolerans]|uniref:HlyD family secretion protein n=1 Tax=Clostridium aciditolerans TaxID=339861 RepID=UPI0031B63C0F
MDKKKNVKVLVLITLIIAVSSGFIFKSIKDKQKDEFVYYGTVEADKINLSTEIGGKVKEIKLQEGSKVKAGELIATIDSDENSLKLQDSEIAIKSAENELGKTQDGTRAEEIKAQEALVRQAQSLVKQGEAAVKIAENNLNSAQTNFDYKKKIYDDAAALYQSGADSKYKMDAAKNELDNATNVLNNAKDSLESSRAQVSNYSAQLDSSNEKLQLLVNGATERDKNSAQYGVEKAKNSYELNKVMLDKSNIVTSTDGIIETINFKKGEYIAPGSAVATLLDDKNLWVKIYVPESVLTHIKLEKEVTLTSDFLKDKTIKGKIIYISPEAEFTPMNIVTKNDRTKLVYEVKIKILDNIDSVKTGMLLDVNLK